MKAWKYDFELRQKAKPVDLASNPSDWGRGERVLELRRFLMGQHWYNLVPSSRAPDVPYLTMVQAWENQGYDVSEAEGILDDCLAARDRNDYHALEVLSGRVQKHLLNAPKCKTHSYWNYDTPESLQDIINALPHCESGNYTIGDSEYSERVLAGWLGQLSGAAYGTALEGYTGENLRAFYGDRLNHYVTEPETLNDDVTYELCVMEAVKANGLETTADDIADQWLRMIPSAWSAEQCALDNLRKGFYPPESAKVSNFWSEWIGAQMRTMIWGYLAPGEPMKALRYAYMDSSISHEKNGIYGGIHSAVLTSLAFSINDSRELVIASGNYIPQNTLFATYFHRAIDAARSHPSHLEAWATLSKDMETFNWIHVIPNMVAVVLSLWYCENNFDCAMRILGDCGLDVDCNAGEVGSALGVMQTGVGAHWTEPLGNKLETYLPGYESIEIADLAKWTCDLYETFKN